MIEITFPRRFTFLNYGSIDFNDALSNFDWDIESGKVVINLSGCQQLNYQALSLLVLYIWKLRAKGCYIELLHSANSEQMWRRMGAMGWYYVLSSSNQNFIGDKYKPLIAIRDNKDFKSAVSKAENYSKDFNIEYEKTLRYVLSELLYNTLEHGLSYERSSGQTLKIPSITQFTWYRDRGKLSFIVADLGIGIKRHLEKTYPGFESDEEALRYSVKPQVSGTFSSSGAYKTKDNAGVGLFISSNIMKRLKADMYIVSGKGLLHISPRDSTSKELQNRWPGTIVYGEVKLGIEAGFELHSLMSELRDKARSEIQVKQDSEEKNTYYIHIRNYFGQYAEDKDHAKRFRDRHIIPNVESGKKIVFDFADVVAAPHSFLSALFATPITIIGLHAYKKIKIINAEPEIRETIDFIFDENTESQQGTSP